LANQLPSGKPTERLQWVHFRTTTEPGARLFFTLHATLASSIQKLSNASTASVTDELSD